MLGTPAAYCGFNFYSSIVYNENGPDRQTYLCSSGPGVYCPSSVDLTYGGSYFCTFCDEILYSVSTSVGAFFRARGTIHYPYFHSLCTSDAESIDYQRLISACCAPGSSQPSSLCPKGWGHRNGADSLPRVHVINSLGEVSITGITGSEITLSGRVLYFKNLKEFINIYYLGEERHICLS